MGEPKVPHLRIRAIGDGLVPPAMPQGYGELVEQKGHSEWRPTMPDCGAVGLHPGT